MHNITVVVLYDYIELIISDNANGLPWKTVKRTVNRLILAKKYLTNSFKTFYFR